MLYKAVLSYIIQSSVVLSRQPGGGIFARFTLSSWGLMPVPYPIGRCLMGYLVQGHLG